MSGSVIRQRARPQVYLWPDGRNRSRYDLGPDTIGFSYSKQLQQATGGWTLQLLPRQGTKGPAHMGHLTDLARLVRSNGVISIGFDEPGGICFGLVDSVRTIRALAGGRVSYGLELAGSDFGKMLASDHIVHAALTVSDQPDFIAKVSAVTGPDHALVHALPGVWGPLNRDGDPVFSQAPVADIAKWLLDVGPSMQIPLLSALGGTGKPGEFVKTDVTTWNDGRIQSESPATFQGTLWDFLRSILDEDLYELILDTIPVVKLGRPSVIPEIRLTIRPKPFDEAGLDFMKSKLPPPDLTWDTLRTRVDGLKDWEIGEYEVLREELGISDADVFSYYLVTSENELVGNPDGLKEGLIYPAVDLHALQRAGLRAYEGRMSLIGPNIEERQQGEGDETEIANQVLEARNRVFNWYRGAEYFEAGSITVAGRDRFRVGDPVSLPWRWPMRGKAKGVRYYCVGTTHAWSLGSPYTTTLQLTRGHNQSTIDLLKLEIAAAGAPFGNPNMIASTSW